MPATSDTSTSRRQRQHDRPYAPRTFSRAAVWCGDFRTSRWTQLGDSRLDEFLDERSRHRIRERQPDRALRRLVAIEVSRQAPADRRCHGIQAAMILECGVPDERLTVEPERGNPIAERLLGTRRRRQNGGADLL